MGSYRWKLEWTPEVPTQVSALSKSDRASIFAKIADLASAEDPYSVPGVEILYEKRFKRQRKIRQGNYRIRFHIIPGELVDQKFTYKGKIEILEIGDRKDIYKR